MKKLLCALLIVVLTFVVLPVLSLAASNPAISLERIDQGTDDMIEVCINLENNPGIVSADLKVSFSDNLKLVAAQNGSVFSALSYIPPKALSNDLGITSSSHFVWSGFDIQPADIKNGTILTLQFQANRASTEAYQIVVTTESGDVIDRDMNEILLNATMTIEPTLNGWVEENGKKCFYTEGKKVVANWVLDGGKWYYLGSDGYMLSNSWKQINGVWYYFGTNGVMQTGWLKLGSTWYYFNASGAMATGWLKVGSTWYYFNASGAMVTGWLKDAGTWYYFNASGAMATGWAQDSGTWYYFNSSGAMVTGWLKDAGTWYYFKASGAMATGWLKVGSTWYYFKASGAMATGWLKVGSTWYYFNASGAMATGSVKIGTKVYQFNSSGACLNP